MQKLASENTCVFGNLLTDKSPLLGLRMCRVSVYDTSIEFLSKFQPHTYDTLEFSAQRKFLCTYILTKFYSGSPCVTHEFMSVPGNVKQNSSSCPFTIIPPACSWMYGSHSVRKGVEVLHYKQTCENSTITLTHPKTTKESRPYAVQWDYFQQRSTQWLKMHNKIMSEWNSADKCFLKQHNKPQYFSLLTGF